jgi:FtsP/CotA-like multicopper oxidase with cupredoxin domain
MNPQRRHLLFGSASAAAAAVIGLPALAAATGEETDVDVHIELHAVTDEVAIRPGAKTRVWRYQGKLIRGEPSTLETSVGQLRIPVIRVRRGQRLRIDLINGLPESTIIHWHGLHVPETMDGHPRFAIAPGERYRYQFTVDNRAGSYWFHPHPHGRTGKQVYAGLAGLFLVSDDEEAALALPRTAQDLPLVLQDRNFDDNNQFVYLDAPGAGATTQGGGMMGGGMGGMGAMMARMMGVLGDEILVNGQPKAGLEVGRRAYRLRLLNASNTRRYKLAWSDGSPLTVIGTDGGLLAAPLQRDYVMLAPAERIDVWVDFGQWPVGSELALQSLAFDGGMSGGMMSGGGGLPDGSAFLVHRFRVQEGARIRSSLPKQLSTLPAPKISSAVNANQAKVFELTMGRMAWGINGQGFEMLQANAQETVKLGTHEVWEFRNEGRGAMMGMVMAHALHVHGLQFRVIARSMSSQYAGQYNSVKAGLVDEGWKDTVMVMPGERVRVLLAFTDHTGLFLYHCHMLEHEDAGMMRNYRVVV